MASFMAPPVHSVEAPGHKPSLLFVWGIGGELRKYRSTGEIRMTMLK